MLIQKFGVEKVSCLVDEIVSSNRKKNLRAASRMRCESILNLVFGVRSRSMEHSHV